MQYEIKAKKSQDDDRPLMLAEKSLYVVLDFPNVAQNAINFFAAPG